MLLEMEKGQFESFGDLELFLACSEPAVRRLSGREPAAKKEIMDEWSEGQRATCLFRVLYPASGSERDFRAWLSYLLEQPSYWDGVLGSLRFFGDAAMLSLLEDARGVVEQANRSGVSGEDDELREQVRFLYENFRAIVPESIERIAAYIRSHPDQFVRLSH